MVRRAVDQGRPAHALLLTGPEHVGKTTLALDLAAGLLCLAEDPRARPCRMCAACHKLEHGNHPDLHRLAPEGGGQQIRVAQVQALAAELALLPLEGRFRVAVLERAQRLNLDAQNALLKTLEEPPAQVVIVLAADDLGSLLPTVISRCVRIRLGPLAAEQIGGLLDELGLADQSRGATLGRVAGGLPGIAISLAGQPEAVIARARLAGLLLDLLGEGRARRLQAVGELVADGSALATTAMGTAESPATPAERRASPAERRAAAAQVVSVWRDVARDLAFATRGARRELRQPELLEELQQFAARVDARAAALFLARLDATAAPSMPTPIPSWRLTRFCSTGPRRPAREPCAVRGTARCPRRGLRPGRRLSLVRCA